ncbi:hypothetical protein H257_03790 [Aphanomyces astaci]|uniref:Phosphatidylinositol-specific phospholipase C X domain-containing protein n=1 Tax=Aphanomyces astaci TaxID=112090 RepID=W4GYB6_APHAT|nr:hypothetical protein H257_03790 [Aphanomyces astaci]ETV84647.1 hypothetical protein H257_03790 [Aphanomyces astaci]|eukprot:XP_009826339.1 hypothetical protein H257_03790 [Aphanomyces astaci]
MKAVMVLAVLTLPGMTATTTLRQASGDMPTDSRVTDGGNNNTMEKMLTSTTAVSSTACNGYVGYCNQTLGQVLWIGAHNALTDTGFALQRNQFVSGPALLDAGIRYLDIDTCAFVANAKRTVPMICHGYEWYLAQVHQPTVAGLLPIKQWLDKHPHEVIVLNFGDIADFTAVNIRGIATSTLQLRDELSYVVRQVFGSMAIWRDEPWDAAVNSNKATLGDLIAANRRVVVNVGISRSDSPNAWGQSDRVCREAWYPVALEWNDDHTDYNWAPVVQLVDDTMRSPCATNPQLLNKLEFQFHNALGGSIDAASVGVALNVYMESLVRRNGPIDKAPYFPFNLILTDHADKWKSYYPNWHRRHLKYLER